MIRAAAISLLLFVLTAAALAVPPLTPAQQEQLKTANDELSTTDEPALYPLMENALSWQNGDESGATVPDYAAILKSPADNRGSLFLIEGLYAGRTRVDGDKLKARTRPGPWSGKLQEWVIVINQEKDEVVVVYVVDPPLPAAKMPVAGTPVRLVARFFKVLKDADQKGTPMSYLTFVAKSATIGKPGEPTPSGSSSGLMQAIGFVGLLGVVYVVFRAYRAVKGAKKAEFSLHKDETPEEREKRLRRLREEEEGQPPLPTDPVEALAELERRQKAEGAKPPENPGA